MGIHRRIAVALFAMTLSLASLPAAPTAQSQEPKAQQNMIKEIRHQLVLLPWYSVFDNLSFRIEGSKVVLMGQVVRPTLKSDAEAAVKGVEGVSSADRATRSAASMRSSGEADVRDSSASRSTSAKPTMRRRERLMASASCLTTVCSQPAARSGSSRAAWRMRISSPRW